MGAVISNCGRYRYYLRRDLAPGQLPDTSYARTVFIMLNPSTADAEVDDPTIRKCMGFARRWSADLEVVNLYALRATDPARLRTADDPVGPDNDAWIRDTAVGSVLIIAAWGAFAYNRMPGGRDRIAHVAALVADAGNQIHCLRRTKAGFPEHPLYLPYELSPLPWSPGDGRVEFRARPAGQGAQRCRVA